MTHTTARHSQCVLLYVYPALFSKHDQYSRVCWPFGLLLQRRHTPLAGQKRWGQHITSIQSAMPVSVMTATDFVVFQTILVSFSRAKWKGSSLSNFRFNSATGHSKFGTDRLNTLQTPRNDLHSVTLVGCCILRIPSVAFVNMPSLPGCIMASK